MVYGRVPAERHDHYTVTGTGPDGEPAGELTGWTIVTREPEFLPSDYTSLLGLGRYEQSVGRCGFSHEHHVDPELHFYRPGWSDRCPACAARAVAQRQLDDADQATVKAKGDQLKATDLLPSDGVVAVPRLLTPSEVDAARAGRGAPQAPPGAAVSAGPERPARRPGRLAGR